jgi:serine/threonine-protein kinase HipA
MHLKNWSLLYRDGRTPTLAPGYDYVFHNAVFAGPRFGPAARANEGCIPPGR